MTLRRIVGLILAVVGVVVLLWGGVFWQSRDTLFQAGSVKVQTEHDKGVAVPPIVGGACLVAGIVLLVIPERRRV